MERVTALSGIAQDNERVIQGSERRDGGRGCDLSLVWRSRR